MSAKFSARLLFGCLPHIEIAIVDNKVALANDGFFKSSLGFLPWLWSREMGEDFNPSAALERIATIRCLFVV